jgi:hypothetical protein
MAERTPKQPITATESGLVFVAQAQRSANGRKPGVLGPALLAKI